MEKLKELAKVCTDAQRKLVREMIHDAVDYVRAVVVMETAASNIAGLDSDAAKDALATTDRARTVAHDAFIASVNVVNRICDKHEFPRIYTGGDARREYGDFAIALVTEIFTKRS